MQCQAVEDDLRAVKPASEWVEARLVSSGAGDDLRHDVQRIFKELKPQERALLWLAHVEESSHHDIGEALGVQEKSVKVLLFRARKRLGDLLKRSGIGPEVLR